MPGPAASWDPYRGILAGPVDGPRRVRATYPDVDATAGLVVAHRASGVRGGVVRVEKDAVVVRTELGTERLLRLSPGAFEVEGRAVTLVRPRPAAPTTPARTASGSRPLEARRARVARASRIWVEGVHDAELVEKVWGDDLRGEGVVVERLDGIDHLADRVASFAPGPDARLGVLVDHLVPGSKEARLAAAVTDAAAKPARAAATGSAAAGPFVLVRGTPFVDVWQAVRPKVLGITAWPDIPRGQPWKEGICGAFGVADPALLWKWLLASVRSYGDLEPALVGAVEELIDFVTAPPG